VLRPARLLIALAVLGTGGTAAAGEACGIFELAASGSKATKNVVVNLTSLLASEVEATGKCSSIAMFAAEDFEQGCGADPACVTEFAEYDELDLMITGTVRFEADGTRVKLRLLDAARGRFVSTLEREAEGDPDRLMERMAEFAADLMRDQRAVVVAEEPSELDLIGDLDLVDDLDDPGSAEDDSIVVEAEGADWEDVPIDEVVRPVEEGPIELEVSTLEERERIAVEEGDLADAEDMPGASTLLGHDSTGPELLFRIDPRLGIKAFGGVAFWQEPHGEFGLDFSIHVKPQAFFDVEVGTWIGTKHQPGSDDLWTYALLPFSIGFGAKGQRLPLVHPYVVGAAMGIVYFVSPNNGLPQLAFGGCVKGGIDLMIKQRFGLFVEGSVGGVYAGHITSVVDEDYWPGHVVLSLNTGVILQL